MPTLQISEDILPLGHFKTHAAQVLKALNSAAPHCHYPKR